MNFFTNVIYSFIFWTIQVIIKKHPSRNINAQNFWLYIFGMLFNLVAICVQDFDAVMNKLVQNFLLVLHSCHLLQFMILTIPFECAIWCRGFFHGYSFITVLMILNHALRYWQLDHISCFHYCPVGLSCILFYFLPNQIKCLYLLCSGIAVSMVMKYADNIVKVLATIFSVTCVCKQCRSEPQQLISRLNECVAT